jgi:hypothetical protein
MFDGAFAELALLSLILGGPALIAVLWERHDQKRKDDTIFQTVEEFRNELE